MAKGNRGGKDGREGGAGGVKASDIVSSEDLVSKREGKTKEVDEVLTVFKHVYNEYGHIAESINVAELKGKANAGTIAFADASGNVSINKKFFDNDALNKSYDASVEQKWSPKRGNKSALQAVTAHELGHSLTMVVGKAMGEKDPYNIDKVATKIVNEARKETTHRGVVQMARKISRYATTSNAEAVAEAYCDVYCNGSKASKEAIAIVNVMNKYLKKK